MPQEHNQSPPKPVHHESVVDTFFGVRVEDPYRWLEQGGDPEVEAWVDEQTARTEQALNAVPGRKRLEARLAELLGIGSISLPAPRKTRAGKLRLFFRKREGKQEQPVLYVRDGLGGPDRILVDPNAMAGGGSVSLDWFEPSHDGALLAYGVSKGGTEDSTLYLREVESGRDLGDVIDRTRYASLSWNPDGRSFFYTRYPAAGTVPAADERFYRRLYQHRLGDDPAKDALVFGAELEKTDFPGCDLSPDGRYLVVTVSRGFSESALYLSDRRDSTLSFRRITPEGKHRYGVLARSDALYVMSDEGAPRYRIFAVDPRDPERSAWREIVPEHASDTLRTFEVVGNRLLATYLHDAGSRIEEFDLRGHALRSIPLPTLGTSDGCSGLPEGPDAFFAFDSFAVAPEVRHLDVRSGRVERWEGVVAPIRAEDFVVEELGAVSKDGTPVIAHLVRRRDLPLDGTPRPTLLYGYGGFNESVLPRFSRSLHAFLERGGVYVQAIVRGGGEFGEAWHRAGQLEQKQNVFDDFISVAEMLIARRITDPAHLAIHGRSNGGLLVLASVTQRPELFRAAVAGVPLSDMLRYPRFLIGKLWESEYGSPDVESQFRALLAYSPYHHVKSGAAYPALLVTTAEGDTRVDPLHSRKFVARAQAATSADRPIYLRVERKTGHGAGTPLSLQLAELADLYSFLFSELGLASSDD
jgi:prolyl oligopeptidase